MNHRVVITGIGIYSCIGKNLDEVAKSLYEGKSGIIVAPERKEFGYRSALTGFVERPNLKGLIDRRARITMPEHAEYAYVSTKEAMKVANIDEEYFENNEVGIIYGNDTCAQAVIEGIDKLREKKDTVLLGSASVFQVLNSTVNMNLSTIFKLKGINLTMSAACASGSHSIGLGYMFIKNGMQDMIVCGGAQETNLYSMPNFDALGAFSIRENEPHKASRPFDRDRDGLVPSGGAATVIIESLESAKRRGVPILGEIIGYGFSSNGAHISNPTVDGPYRSLIRAIQDSKVQLKDIDYLNAHATSTLAGDASEAEAIYKAFEDSMPYISSTKGMTGHECWMAGASEVVYTTLMMQNNFIAPNLNFENPDEHSQKLKIANTTIEKNIDVYLSNSFGFGGTNSSLIVKKWNPNSN
ncbi:MAG: beta-ketoacyl-[acyl-carrier-protein] synthase family protein [Chitinophagaceae bacterium]|nr:MAG: beta-ketoacyl synthase [Bacteroidetes bacterium OLB11]MCC6447307.1 beta-ketoacyl-[acyl-carrier-protein] synthase family protein [Chitinophagaceae bacterium]HMN31774.1 beta-ketoacyl-[acyl-carrier-protein] synthase family protein [Chitinophagaceae bacterium]